MPLRAPSNGSEPDIAGIKQEKMGPMFQTSDPVADPDLVVKEPTPKKFNEYAADQTVFLHEIESVLENRFGQWHQCVMSNLVNIFHLKMKDLPQKEKDDVGRKPHDRSRRAKYLVWLLVMPKRKPELADKILYSVQKQSWTDLWSEIVSEARLTKWDDVKEDESEREMALHETLEHSEASPAYQRRKVLQNIINDVVPKLTGECSRRVNI